MSKGSTLPFNRKWSIHIAIHYYLKTAAARSINEANHARNSAPLHEHPIIR